jgi:hypothetical protein
MDNKELFMGPKTTQYGSHMVMTDVVKPTKTKYINIDTRFRDEYNSSQLINYNITLPERINDVRCISVTNVEIPMTMYNISASLGNNVFYIKNNETVPTTLLLTVSDNNYTITSLVTAINSQLTTKFSSDISLSVDTNYKCYFDSISKSYTIDFAVDSNGNSDKYNLKNKLGWILGFRDASYSMVSTSKLTSEAIYDVTGTKYLYLAVDEFTKGNQSSFISPLPRSLINKNILARIALNNTIYGFGSMYEVNRFSGALVSDTRSYTGKADLQKLNIQLLNEFGNPVNLNGLDISLCLEIEHE